MEGLIRMCNEVKDYFTNELDVKVISVHIAQYEDTEILVDYADFDRLKAEIDGEYAEHRLTVEDKSYLFRNLHVNNIFITCNKVLENE